jgi:membrane protein
MASHWRLDELTLKEFGQRIWSKMQKDEVMGRAAQLAYYLLLALFPLLLFLTSVLGLLVGSGTGIRHSFFNYLSKVLPGDAFKLVDATMYEVSRASGGGKIAFGILAALWAASSGVGAIAQALNVAYGVKESRPWWKQRVVIVGLTVALSVIIITALMLTLFGGRIVDHIAATYGFSAVFTVTWKVLQWPIALAFMLFAFALIYYVGPDLKEQKWKWVTPGSIVGVALWLLVSFGLRTYLQYFNSYSKYYGSLGAVIILMLWLFLTGAAILIGGEVNAELEDLAARRGAADAKEHGEKAPGQKSEGKETSYAEHVVAPARAAQLVHASQQPARASERRRERHKTTLGTGVAVFGAFCLALVQRLTRRTTIHRGR